MRGYRFDLRVAKRDSFSRVALDASRPLNQPTNAVSTLLMVRTIFDILIGVVGRVLSRRVFETGRFYLFSKFEVSSDKDR